MGLFFFIDKFENTFDFVNFTVAWLCFTCTVAALTSRMVSLTCHFMHVSPEMLLAAIPIFEGSGSSIRWPAESVGWCTLVSNWVLTSYDGAIYWRLNPMTSSIVLCH